MIVYRLFVPGHGRTSPYPRGIECGPTVYQMGMIPSFERLAKAAFDAHSVLEMPSVWPILVYPLLPTKSPDRYKTVAASFYGVPCIHRPGSLPSLYQVRAYSALLAQM